MRFARRPSRNRCQLSSNSSPRNLVARDELDVQLIVRFRIVRGPGQ
jgi:hypothetical protein